MLEQGENQANVRIKARIKERRKERGISSRDMSERVTAAGYYMSYASYRNMESASETGTRMNKLLLHTIAQVLDCSPNALATPAETALLPLKSLWAGKRGPRTPKYKTEAAGRWPGFVEAMVKLHRPDPDDLDCCAGCEMLWPCTSYEIIERKGFQDYL